MGRNSWVCLLLFLASCDFIASQEGVDSTYSKQVVPYDLLNPDKLLKLPSELNEISGLAWYKGNLATIDDEEGIVFIISTTGEMVDQIRFDSDTDYEGVAVRGSSIYVVKANGDIFQIKTSVDVIEKFENALMSKNDVEGLAYDWRNNRILIACKNKAGIEKEIEGKAIYGFDIIKKELSEEPLIVLQKEDLNHHLTSRDSTLNVNEFGPSGMAIHPKTAQLFILSHNGKLLVVMDAEFNLQEVVKLKNRLFKQPEGICFSPDGTLYISNEGRGGRGNILSFSPVSPVR